jgi:hypothetical protein
VTTDHDIHAEIKASIRSRKDQEFAATLGGAVMLDDLWERLQPFQGGNGVHIDKGPRDKPKAIDIRRDLRRDPIASWTRNGLTLVFTSTGGDAEARTVVDAIKVTLHYLETGTVLPSAVMNHLPAAPLGS